MTIGIAACGENAGRAVLAALAAIEAVGTGAIGGFVSAVALAGGEVLRGETQTGGAAATRFSVPRPVFETATMAALISSGPNRPEPLAAFTLAAPGVGIVTGHRLPSAPGQDGTPMNQQVLDLMAGGVPARRAVERVIAANPSADCGLAAIDAAGAGCALQTPAASRPDAHLLWRSKGPATVCVLHNAIQPHQPLAVLAVEIAMAQMVPDLQLTAGVVLARGCPVRHGAQASLRIDAEGHVLEITLPDAPRQGMAVLNLGYRPRVLGAAGREEVLVYEPFIIAHEGVVVSIDGAEAMQIATGAPA